MNRVFTFEVEPFTYEQAFEGERGYFDSEFGDESSDESFDTEWNDEWGRANAARKVLPPPVEGPYSGITGALCASGSGKCWKGARARDIVDTDVPWNDKSNRSPANYGAVLDYFNVGNSKGINGSKGPENPRYIPVAAGATWCNIYAHDVTHAMWASVPHWVRDPKQKKAPVGWNELNANRTVDWLQAHGRTNGWIPIDKSLTNWIQLQFQRKASMPLNDPSVTENLRITGEQVAAGSHQNPKLLSQPSYIAQQFANQGLPTIVIWKNPKGHGHIAMIRPERNSLRGKLNSKGVFVPRSAQAGRKNWTNQLAENMVPHGLFFVHE